jgi:drug/metabolite transporter (DMT)-like permease
MMKTIVAGTIAGAMGEFVLNVMTYGDMALRGRPASEMPSKVVDRLAETAGVELGEPWERSGKIANRQEAIGALLGYGVAAGVAVGYAVLRRAGLRAPIPVAGLAIGGGAMLLSDSIATAVGATDPTEWGVEGWLSDIVPHAAYGVVTAATLELIDR